MLAKLWFSKIAVSFTGKCGTHRPRCLWVIGVRNQKVMDQLHKPQAENGLGYLLSHTFDATLAMCDNVHWKFIMQPNEY